MKMTFWMIAKLGHRYIESTHRSAEFIMKTGAVPPFWFSGKIQPILPISGKIKCLRKTKKLISYFRHNTVAGDEATRAMIVSKLVETYNRWTELDWKDLNPL